MSGLFEDVEGITAEFSSCGVYRYTLTRRWSDGPRVAFLMFNPSTATATEDDATIRKCVGFAQRWWYGRLVILNLYGIRGTDPKTPARTADPIGPLNDYWIAKSLHQTREVICAWGCSQHAPKNMDKRIGDTLRFIRGVTYDEFPISCLGYRQDGHPRHPLMLKYTTPREPFVWRSK